MGTPSCTSSPRSLHATFLLRCSINRLALACRLLGTVSKTVASSRLIGASSSSFAFSSTLAFDPSVDSFTDHAYRFLDAFIDQTVVPLQHLIIQRYLGPVVEVLSIEDGLHLVVEGLHLSYLRYPLDGEEVANEACPTIEGLPKPSFVRDPCV